MGKGKKTKPDITRRKRIERIFLVHKDLDKLALGIQELFFDNIRKWFELHGNLTDRQIEVAEHIISENQKFNETWKIKTKTKKDSDQISSDLWDDPDPLDNFEWGGPDSETDEDEIY